MAKFSWKAAVEGDYADAADWSPRGVPGAGDNVTIAASGTYTVTVSENAAADSLALKSHAALDVQSGAFSVGSSGGALTIAADAAISVMGGGTLQLFERVASTVTDTVDGQVSIASGGALRIDAPGAKGGSLIISGAGSLLLSEGAQIFVNPDGGAISNYLAIYGAGIIHFNPDNIGLVSNSGIIDANM